MAKTPMTRWPPLRRVQAGFAEGGSEPTERYRLVAWRKTDAPQFGKPRGLRYETWIAERLRCATIMLRDTIDIDPEKRGGVPVVKGTRVPVATILAELAEDATISSVADDRALDATVLQKILQGIAIHLDRSFLK